MKTCWEDARMALIRFVRDWPYTLTAGLSLAMGTAAVISLFTIINGVILKPLPFYQPDRLVMIRSFCPQENQQDAQTSMAEFLDWESQCVTMDLAAFQLRQLDLAVDDRYHRITGFRVSKNFFRMLRVNPSLGVSLDVSSGAGDLNRIVLSKGHWQNIFRGDANVIGDVIPVNSWLTWPNPGSQGYQLVGVLPDDMRFLPSSSWFLNAEGFGPNSRLGFCMPMDVSSAVARDFRSVDTIGRLREGVSMEQAQAEMDLIAARLSVDYPRTNAGWSIRLVSLNEYVYRRVHRMLFAGFVASTIVLLLACGTANQLLMLRDNKRDAELAIASAIGATPARLARQAFFAVAIVTATSSVTGVLFAIRAVEILNSIAPNDIPVENVNLDLTVSLFTFAAAAICCTAIAVLPIKRVLTPRLNVLLNASTRTATQSPGTLRLLRSIVAVSVAASYVLLVAAGLLLLKTHQMMQVDPGFDAKDRLTMTIALPEAKHEWNRNTSFCHEVMDGVRELPGVLNVAAIQGMPMGRNKIGANVSIEGKPLIRGRDLPSAFIRVVTDDYFKTMGIPVLRGRTFIDSDSIGEIGQTRVVIINQTMAERCWPNDDPIGRRLKTFEQGRWLEIIGVVGDVRSDGLDRPPVIDMYYPEKLFPQPHIVLITQTQHSDPLAMATSVRSCVTHADPDANITHVATLESVVARSQAIDRYFTVLLATLAAIGTALAACGVLLTTMFSVTHRSRELAIRVCCGAAPRDIVALIVGGQIKQVAAGILLGGVLCYSFVSIIPLSWESARYFRSVAWAIVPVGLGTIAIVTSSLVAIREAWQRKIVL